MGPFPPPSDPPSPSAPLHHSANREPSTLSIDVGGLDRFPLLPHAPPFFHGRNLRGRLPPRAIQGHHGLLLRPDTFVEGFLVQERSPPIRWPAPGMAPWTLALLLDRLSGHPSFSPSPTICASVLALPDPSSGFTSQSYHLPTATTGNDGLTADSRVIAPAGVVKHGPELQAPNNYFGSSTLTLSAAASPSTPHTGLVLSPQTLPAPSTTNVYGLLRLQQRSYPPRKPHRRRFALGAPQHRHSRPTISFHRTIGLHQHSYHILSGFHDATASGLERLSVPFENRP